MWMKWVLAALSKALAALDKFSTEGLRRISLTRVFIPSFLARLRSVLTLSLRIFFLAEVMIGIQFGMVTYTLRLLQRAGGSSCIYWYNSLLGKELNLS